ncbi:MAG: 50S ribosomal protein L10 [Ignavibacteria bacterium]|nr:50S ribosomal protein L10 [Ignavibacteria bacterium]
MVTKEKKQELVDELVGLLRGAKGLYLVDYSRMTVKDSNAVRSELTKKGIKFKVAKNTLILRAMKEVGGFDIPEDKVIGQSGLALGYADPIAPAKIIREFSEKNNKLQLKAAVIEGQVFDGSQLKQISELPTREDIIAAILGSLNSPISGIVGTINAVMRDVASLVEEVAKKKAA